MHILSDAVKDLVGDYPVAPLKTAVILNKNGTRYGEVKDWCMRRRLPVLNVLAECDWTPHGGGARPLLREQRGQRACGRKTFLFSECADCL